MQFKKTLLTLVFVSFLLNCQDIEISHTKTQIIPACYTELVVEKAYKPLASVQLIQYKSNLN